LSLDLSTFNAEIKSRGTSDPLFARMSLIFDQIQTAVNQQGQAVGIDSSGHTTPPDAPTAINVKAANGTAHVTITDNTQRNRALHYFVEADTDPAFSQPHVVHLGASRGAFIPLPGMKDNSDVQPWYFRAYSMHLGSSQASAHQVFGGSATPTPVTMGGSVALTPLPSTGSGTASTTGQQGGTGFGTSQLSKAQ
jgi:hypothetical protein